MRRIGQTRIAAILLLALLLGVAGPLWAGCTVCAAVKAAEGTGCHGERAPQVHRACCGGKALETAEVCCGRFAAPSPRAPLWAPSKASAATLPSPTAAPATLVRQGDAAPVRLDDPLLHEGVGLYTLHSILLI